MFAVKLMQHLSFRLKFPNRTWGKGGGVWTFENVIPGSSGAKSPNNYVMDHVAHRPWPPEITAVVS
jgi:hypothetical protein